MASPNRFGTACRRFYTFALLLALALGSSGCGDRQQRLQSSLDKAANFLHRNDWDKANVEVRNALQIDPKNARAYLLMAQISEGQHEVQRAYGAYSKAVELDPKLWAAQLGLARLLLFVGEPDKAQLAVDLVLNAEPDSVAALTLKAALMLRRGDRPEARSLLDALAARPGRLPAETALLIAGLNANQGRVADALAILERALKDDPDHPTLLRVAAEVAGLAPADDGLGARADGYYQRATQRAPKDDALWRAWAKLHISRNDPRQAEVILRRAIESEPLDSSRRADLINFVAGQRGLTEAGKDYDEAVKMLPREMAPRFVMVDLLRRAGRAGQAEDLLREIVAAKPEPQSMVNAKSQLASAALARGDAAQAQALVADVLTINPRDSLALQLRARLSLAQARPLDAVSDLRAVAADQPGSAEVIGLLARAHRAAGQARLAREVLADAVKARPDDAELRLLLVDDMLMAKELREAGAELDAGIKLAPQAFKLYEGKAQLALMQRDEQGAERALLALKAAAPGLPAASLRLGTFYARQGRLEPALKAFEDAAALAPYDTVPLVSIVALLTRAQKFDQADARLDRSFKQAPDSSVLLRLKGDIALARPDLAAAADAYQRAIQADPRSAASYQGLSNVRLRSGDLAGAISALEAGEKAVPQDLILPMTRAETLVGAHRVDEAIALYETLMKAHPEEDAVANNLAFLLADNRTDPASLERALAVSSRFVHTRNPQYLDSLGWVRYRRGEYAQAVTVLEQAVALSGGKALHQMHLGLALVKSGNAERGKDLLRRAVKDQADLPQLAEARVALGAR